MKVNSHAPVHHIGIPNPMFEGELNMYVIAGDPLTLVDTGIGTPEAMTALEQGLAALGFAVEDVRQVVLTHKHADHIGLARDILDRSGATVSAHLAVGKNDVHPFPRRLQWSPLGGAVTGWHRHRHRPGPTLRDDTTSEG